MMVDENKGFNIEIGNEEGTTSFVVGVDLLEGTSRGRGLFT